MAMTEKRAMMRHFLAALAYRTQKALRGAPDSFGTFEAGHGVRTPVDLVRHMTKVLGYTRGLLDARPYEPEPAAPLSTEVTRFHAMLEDLSRHLETGTTSHGITDEQLIQGPLSDAMTHAGQLAVLRRLAGSPIAAESFIEANVDPSNLGPDQPAPVKPLAQEAAAQPRGDMHAKGLTPILNVSNMQESFVWFEKLGWNKGWDWGDPPTFGGVCSGECEIFLCLNGQGGRGRTVSTTTFGPTEANERGVWMSIWVDDVDAVHRRCLAQGIEVTWPPTDMPWNVREMHVRHPDGHVFRIGCGVEETE